MKRKILSLAMALMLTFSLFGTGMPVKVPAEGGGGTYYVATTGSDSDMMALKPTPGGQYNMPFKRFPMAAPSLSRQGNMTASP